MSDRIQAWRPILALARQICEANGAALRHKAVYDDLILTAGDGASAGLQGILDRLESVANALDPETGKLRSTRLSDLLEGVEYDRDETLPPEFLAPWHDTVPDKGRRDPSPVVRDPQICHGALTFTGTRVRVDALFELLAKGLELDDIVGPGSNYYPTVALEQARETLRLAYRLLEAYPHDDASPDGVVWCVKEAEGGRLVAIYSSCSAAEQMVDQRPDEWHVEDWLILDEPLETSDLDEEDR